MASNAPRKARHKEKRYGLSKRLKVERNKLARQTREWRKAQKNPKNRLAQKPAPKRGDIAKAAK